MAREILFCWLALLAPVVLRAQFIYSIDQSIPVVVNGKTIAMPWATQANISLLTSP